jgi:hypothetical protein
VGSKSSGRSAWSITLVPPGTGAKASFAKGLNESELTLYSGHARRGIGPDFDADKSPYENFVIGVNSALHAAGELTSPSKVEQSHYVVGKKNDLEAMKEANTWDPEKYRVWFFAACSSIAYMDELRGGLLPEKMDRHNLDLFGTTQEIPIAAGLTPVFSNLEGILAAETMSRSWNGCRRRRSRSSARSWRHEHLAGVLLDRGFLHGPAKAGCCAREPGTIRSPRRPRGSDQATTSGSRWRTARAGPPSPWTGASRWAATTSITATTASIVNVAWKPPVTSRAAPSPIGPRAAIT